MRQIIFRGKTVKNTFSIFDEKPIKETGDWVYGDLEYQRAKGKYLIHAYYPDGTYDRSYDVDEKTVGQYTGLKDNNDKMIFEGDLLDAVVFDCFDNDKRYKLEVKWLGTGFYAVNTENENNVWELDWLLYQYEEAEVIGNIHDNNF